MSPDWPSSSTPIATSCPFGFDRRWGWSDPTSVRSTGRGYSTICSDGMTPAACAESVGEDILRLANLIKTIRFTNISYIAEDLLPMLIELHLIQNHAPSNLNRDDTGSPKEAFFGGHRRARISSQCLKRSIRKSPIFREAIGDETLSVPSGYSLAWSWLCGIRVGGRPGREARCAALGALGSGKKQDREAEDAAKAAAAPQDAAKRATASPKEKAKKGGPRARMARPSSSSSSARRGAGHRRRSQGARRRQSSTVSTKCPPSELEQAIAKKLHPKGQTKPVIPGRHRSLWTDDDLGCLRGCGRLRSGRPRGLHQQARPRV